MPFVIHPPAGLKKMSLVDGGAAIFVGADDPAARIHGTGRIKGTVGCGRASMPLAAHPALGVYRPLIRHGPLGRATSCPRCGIRFPGPLGHGNRAAAWLCPRFIRRGGASGTAPLGGRRGGILLLLTIQPTCVGIVSRAEGDS